MVNGQEVVAVEEPIPPPVEMRSEELTAGNVAEEDEADPNSDGEEVAVIPTFEGALADAAEAASLKNPVLSTAVVAVESFFAGVEEEARCRDRR